MNVTLKNREHFSSYPEVPRMQHLFLSKKIVDYFEQQSYIGDHPFSRYTKISEKILFPTP